MPKVCDFPVFDADNHFYETRDSFTRHLPDRYKGAIDYVELRGRTKIMIRGTVSEYIPNPTFEVVARPGRPGGVLQERQSRGQVLPRGDRGAHAGHPGLPGAGAPPRGDERARRRPVAHVPHPGQPARRAHARRPRADACRHPLAERVDVRGVAVQLRGPDLRHARHHPPDRREGDRGARVVRGARGQDRPHPSGARPGLPGLAVVRLPGVRPVLAGRGRRRHPRVDALLRQRVRPLHQRLDRAERNAALQARLRSPT